MSHEALIQALKDAANRLSYYNAAEGDSWRVEMGARLVAKAAFDDASESCIEAGIDPKPHLSGYLI